MYKLRNCFLALTVAFFSAHSFGVAFAAQEEQKVSESAASATLPLKNKNILFVLSSEAKIAGQSPRASGVWLQSLAAPYEILKKEGASITLASVKGGKPPIDPRSINSDFATKYTKEFKKDAEAQKAFSQTLPLAKVKAADYDAICYTSSYGMFFDLVNDQDSIRLLKEADRLKKPMGFTSQSVIALKSVMDNKGAPLVRGKAVTAFRNSEEAGSKLSLDHSLLPVSILKTMDHGRTYKTAELPEDQFLKKLKLVGTLPFLSETLLKAQGAEYKSEENWQPFIVEDVTTEGSILLTGQNPDSVELWTDALINILKNPKAVVEEIKAKGSIEKNL
ncbi:type 1 glutamine amidotransferase domain-containing protein [Acetobacteraceae bacterium]|nr:type 1 glutamine amidotransferase domain-containing protein [Acetobacteraceae bacterium]